MKNKPDAVFMGTPDFAVESLRAMIENGYNIKAVFTQPDKPKGRGYKMIPPPVKALALENNLPVYQPKSLRSGEDAEKSLEILKEAAPDIIIVVAYGQILPESILKIPRLGCINIHGSLLPAYRGAAPIEWCVINGEKETGVTSMYMEKGLDTGDMLIKKSVLIGENETSAHLRGRLAKLGADVLLETIEGLADNTIIPKKQDDSISSYAPRITKEMSQLDFKKTAQEVHNTIRAVTGYTMLDGKRLKVYESEIADKKYNAEAGTAAESGEFIVVCGDGRGVKFVKVQPEGKKIMNAEDFLRGKKIKSGQIIG